LIYFSDIDLKVASKFFGTKFACGSSVTGDDEIVIQGDVKDELFDIIPEKWPEVSKRNGFNPVKHTAF
jgi:density-regulated protein DRP1